MDQKPAEKKAFRKVHIITTSCCQSILAIHFSKTAKPDIVAFPVLLLLLGKKLLRSIEKIYSDKAYTSQSYQKTFWQEFQTRLVVEPKRNTVPSDKWQFADLQLYLNSPGLWKSTMDFSAKTFVELTFVKDQQQFLPLTARKTETKRKQILCRFAVKLAGWWKNGDEQNFLTRHYKKLVVW